MTFSGPRTVLFYTIGLRTVLFHTIEYNNKKTGITFSRDYIFVNHPLIL